MQFDRTGHGARVNAAAWACPGSRARVDAAGPVVQLRCTSYDLETAAARIRATAYPQAEEFAVRNVLQPPAEADILAMFGQAELT